jgi:hypothetical protein
MLVTKAATAPAVTPASGVVILDRQHVRKALQILQPREVWVDYAWCCELRTAACSAVLCSVQLRSSGPCSKYNSDASERG